MGDTQKQAKVLADDEKYLTATIQAYKWNCRSVFVAQGAVGFIWSRKRKSSKNNDESSIINGYYDRT